MNPHEELAIGILRELRIDRLKYPSMLNAPILQAVGDRAERKLKRKVSDEEATMATNYLLHHKLVSHVKNGKAESTFQINNDGEAWLDNFDASRKEDSRWRIGTYIGIASLGSGVLGFLFGYYIK